MAAKCARRKGTPTRWWPPVPCGGRTHNGVAVTPDGKHAYVANFESLDVSVIDTATNTVVATVATVEPKWDRRHSGWKTRLRPELCLGPFR
jgi:YVTN family beta-propeller protein